MPLAGVLTFVRRCCRAAPCLPLAGVLTEQSYDEFSQVIANFAGSHFVFSK